MRNQSNDNNQQTQQNDNQSGHSFARGLAIWTLNFSLAISAPSIIKTLREAIHGPETPVTSTDPELGERELPEVVSDLVACQQFCETRSAFDQFRDDARFSELVNSNVFSPSELPLNSSLRRQLDTALEAAKDSFSFTAPAISTGDKLRAFQEANGLIVDGAFGPASASALARAVYPDSSNSLADFLANQNFSALSGRPAFRPDRRSSEDSLRGALETALDVAHERSPYPLETHTGELLKAFQRAHGLSVDGRCGANTLFALAKAIFKEHELPASAATALGLEEGSPESFEGFIDHLIEREGGPGSVETLRSEDPKIRATLLINKKTDLGGITFCGITLTDYREKVDSTATSEDLAALDYTQVRNYYYREYFCSLNLQDLPAPMAYICLDATINHGKGILPVFCDELGLPRLSSLPEGSLPYLHRQALGEEPPDAIDQSGKEAIIRTLFEQRISCYEACGARNKTNNMFGWLNRLDGVNELLYSQECYSEETYQQVEEWIEAAREREQTRRKG